MKAVRAIGTSFAVVSDAAAPALLPGYALLRPLRLARTMPLALPSPEVVPGKEFVAIVERATPRPGVSGDTAWVGKRVVGSAHVSCGVCERCRSGLAVHCRARRSLGDPTLPGCFAERFMLPIANLSEVASHVSDEDAALASAIAAASHIARALPQAAKPFITVLGDTAVGLLTAFLLSRKRDTVRMLTQSPSASMVCEKWGLKHRPLAEAGRRQDQDVIIDAGLSPLSTTATRELARPRARIILPAATRLPCDAEHASAHSDIAANELEVVGIRGEDFPQALALLQEGSIELAPLVTSRIAFDLLPSAIKTGHLAGGIATLAAPPARD